jgi:hypothetical protein
VRLITIGSISMITDGDCKKPRVSFKTNGREQAQWNLKKVGQDSAGVPYYVVQSYSKSWRTNKCRAQYLTAPLGCKSPPFLAPMRTSTDQYWYIVSSGSKFTIQNVACKKSAWPGSYLFMAGGMRKGGIPSFTAMRAATAFDIEASAETL